MEILKVENLSFSYPLREEKALDGITFSVERGDFITVCGATGSGKTTLLRMLKREITPIGKLSGKIILEGRENSTLTEREVAYKVGYVMQRPEQQVVTDKVWHELAFGLENLGVPTDIIRRRVAETACWFGIEELFDKDVSELSGGQLQLLNLASVMVMQPDILLLDEPTSRLDPVAASALVSAVSKLNREHSLTVIAVEHRLQEFIPVSNKILALDKGRLLAYGNTAYTVGLLAGNEQISEGLPAAVRLYKSLGINSGKCPVSITEGRAFIEYNFGNEIRSLPEDKPEIHGEPVLEFKDVFFRYARELPDVLCGLSLKVYEGEILCIVGGNGSGKTTALSAAAALIRPYAGTIRVLGKKLKDYKDNSLYKNCLSLLPQDVQTVFLKNTVGEELRDAKAVASFLTESLLPYTDSHPYDLSGGQQQLLALAKALASKPRVLLLDEPVKGLDPHSKVRFSDVIKELKKSGTTVVIVTHDVEFAAMCADRCAMFFRGEVISSDTPRNFFSGNRFYTTAASRMTQGYYELVATVNDAAAVCLANGKRGDV